MGGGHAARFSLPEYAARRFDGSSGGVYRTIARVGRSGLLFVSSETRERAAAAARDLMAIFRPLRGRTIAIEVGSGEVQLSWTAVGGDWLDGAIGS